MPTPATSTDDKQHGHRLSISLSSEQHEMLLEIARRNRVSLAWVVREAVERLLKEEMPLFHTKLPDTVRRS